MDARTDIELLGQSARQMKNFRVLTQGGARRRPGTIYRATLPGDGRIYAYEFNDDQSYILVFGEQRIDIYLLPNFVLVQSITSGVPWPLVTAKEMSIASSGDTLIICHRDHPIKRLLRTGLQTFALSDFEFEVDVPAAETVRFQPYYNYTDPDVTLTPSATTGAITLTASEDFFEFHHVGVIFRLDSKTDPDGTYKEVIIDSITSKTVAAATVRKQLTGVVATTDWHEAMFSTAHGYPQAVAFHAERLWFAGGRDHPSGIVASKVSAFFNFDVGTAQDDEAINSTVASDTVNDIRHLYSQRNLLIYTNEAELYVPQSETRPITPANIAFPVQTPYGTSRGVRPDSYDGAVLFAQKTGKTIRESLFSDSQVAYSAEPVSFLSSDLINDPVDISVQRGTSETQEHRWLGQLGDGWKLHGGWLGQWRGFDHC
jgi:hypothetical protein